MLRRELGSDDVDRLVAIGRAMTVDELVAYALEFVEGASKDVSLVR
jgi:hypothetical protein